MTPDTEKKLREEIIGWMYHSLPRGKTIPNFEELVDSLLYSRDTYWKERVQEIVKKERGTWAKESIGDKALQSLEVALLDNLK